jgi:hypothetical protein
MLYANFIKPFIDSNISKIHGKPKIMSMLDIFNKLALVDSIELLLIAIFAIIVLYYFQHVSKVATC